MLVAVVAATQLKTMAQQKVICLVSITQVCVTPRPDLNATAEEDFQLLTCPCIALLMLLQPCAGGRLGACYAATYSLT